jgi:O-methyltransferase
VEILRKCADAVEDGARLWVIEKVVEDDLASTSLEVALLDLNMLICFGARERTGSECVHLLRGGIASTAAQWPATAQESAKPPNRAHSTAG